MSNILSTSKQLHRQALEEVQRRLVSGAVRREDLSTEVLVQLSNVDLSDHSISQLETIGRTGTAIEKQMAMLEVLRRIRKGEVEYKDLSDQMLSLIAGPYMTKLSDKEVDEVIRTGKLPRAVSG
jgi:hypothetical protein